MDSQLKSAILSDLKEAMRAGDERRKNVLRLINAAIKNDEVNARVDGRGGVLSDADVLALIRREIKQHQESLEEATGAGRADLAEEQQAELDVLNGYLPKQLSREQIAELARQAIAESGATSAKHMGAVMKVLVPKTKDIADGKLVQAVVKELLG